MNKIFIVNEVNRLDKYLSKHIEASRNQIEQLIKKEFVQVNKKMVKKTSFKVKEEDEIEVTFPTAEESEEINVDFDVEIIYEDEEILVINKPYNLTVHGAPSVKDATLVDWLKSKNISLSTLSAEVRHGIVHRLDKGTSGVMVVAKTNEAHVHLAKQLEEKSMGRYYLAITDLALRENIIIENEIGRNPNHRLQMAVLQSGKLAKSAFAKIELSKNEKYELVSCKLFTGRTHQIRVHLNSINRHILGDNLYGFKGELNKISRFYLHAYMLYLRHPKTNEKMSFVANLADDMSEFLQKNFEMESINAKINKDSFSDIFNFIN